MTTDEKMWGEWTFDSFKEWLDTDYAEEYGDYYGELSYGTVETPWGDALAVDGSDYSYGDGHPMGFVLHFPQPEKYVLFSGTYSSWDSSEYHTIVEVKPVKVTVSRFASVKTGKVFEDPTGDWEV